MLGEQHPDTAFLVCEACKRRCCGNVAGIVRCKDSLEDACIAVVFFMVSHKQGLPCQGRNQGSPCLIIGQDGFESSNMVRASPAPRAPLLPEPPICSV